MTLLQIYWTLNLTKVNSISLRLKMCKRRNLVSPISNSIAITWNPKMIVGRAYLALKKCN